MAKYRGSTKQGKVSNTHPLMISSIMGQIPMPHPVPIPLPPSVAQGKGGAARVSCIFQSPIYRSYTETQDAKTTSAFFSNNFVSILWK